MTKEAEDRLRADAEGLDIVGRKPGEPIVDPIVESTQRLYEDLLREGLPSGGITDAMRQLFTPEQLALIPVRG